MAPPTGLSSGRNRGKSFLTILAWSRLPTCPFSD